MWRWAYQLRKRRKSLPKSRLPSGSLGSNQGLSEIVVSKDPRRRVSLQPKKCCKRMAQYFHLLKRRRFPLSLWPTSQFSLLRLLLSQTCSEINMAYIFICPLIILENDNMINMYHTNHIKRDQVMSLAFGWNLRSWLGDFFQTSWSYPCMNENSV